MKLWQKDVSVNKQVEDFTVGADRDMDLFLAKADVLGSIAHVTMLTTIELISHEEKALLIPELQHIYREVENGNFAIEAGVEDVHSQVELMLTRKLGDVGKKIHSGRSRNDQVLVDIKIYTRSEIVTIVEMVKNLFDKLIALSNANKDVLLPGYTHLQVAMPSSFGLWYGAYAEALVDDMQLLQAAFKVCNRNPLGSAAGYGSSFPLNRQMTTDLLGFDSMNYNVVYAQMGRGKMERIVSYALSSIASTLSRFAMDACLYSSQNFAFLKLPTEFTTGSSIMPHKKNPDVFELIRAKCNKLTAIPNTIQLMTNNLPSGYFRDMQIIKEVFFPSFEELKNCILMLLLSLDKIEIRRDILENPMYKYLFSVEVVNDLVLQGVPFRDAYKQVGMDIENNNFNPSLQINHTHQGSIGNLCNHNIEQLMNQVVDQFGFAKIELAEQELLNSQF